MTRTLSRNSGWRRLLSLMVAFAFVMSVANVGFAAPPQNTVDENVVPVSDPVADPAKDAPSVPADKPAPEPVTPAPEPVVAPDPAPTPADKPADAPVPVPVAEVTAPVAAPTESTEPVRTAETAKVAASGVTASALVDPVLIEGNPALGPGGFKIDSDELPSLGVPTEYTFVWGDLTIHVTVTAVMTEDGMEFSFTSDYPVAKVIAKGGPDAYAYIYPSGVLSDSGLHAPAVPSGKWADLSHIDFYFVAPADLEVIKYNDLDRDGEYDEGEPLLPGWTFSVKNASDVVVGTDVTDDSGSVVFEDLLPGEYTVEETLQDDWVVTTDPYPVNITLTSGGSETVRVGNAQVADVTVLKFEDINGNGERDEGEPLLDGWTIRLLDGETVVDSGVTVDGTVVFEDVAPGDYGVDEVLADGWEPTTDLPILFTLVGGQDVTHEIGNRHLDITKTFELTFVGAPEGATFFAVYALAEGPEVSVELVSAGEGVFSGDVELPYGAVIDSVRWIAIVDDVVYVLGEQTDLDETLVEDVTNEFEYTASVAGLKYDDVTGNGVRDEIDEGLEGWTIGLYRLNPQVLDVSASAVMPSPLPGYSLVATTVTDVNGDYSFSGLLPGTYYVAEEIREGWTMTDGPDVPFDVADGTALTGLLFGNFAQENPPGGLHEFTFDKTVDRETAQPGDIVTYTLTYTLTEDSDPWTDPIPVIDDYDETFMTPVDAAGGVVADGKITWTDNEDMEPGESRTITYTMRVDAEMPVGTTLIDNVALLDVLDGYEDDEQISVTVEPVLPFTEFEFSKSANLTTAAPGAVVTYTLTYTLTADSAPWTDPIPIIDNYDERYLTPVNVGTGVVSGGTITWTDNEDMDPGETRTITYTMRIDATMPVGTTSIRNVALLDVQDGYTDDWTVRVTVAAEPFLPFTGGEMLLLLAVAVAAAASGLLLRRLARITMS